jgi:hypothetical protein
MPKQKHDSDPQAELPNLLKKLLMLNLFALGVPQAEIAKKLRIDIHAVNSFLQGVKKHEKRP